MTGWGLGIKVFQPFSLEYWNISASRWKDNTKDLSVSSGRSQGSQRNAATHQYFCSNRVVQRYFVTLNFRCVKYSWIRVFSDLYFPVMGHNHRFCPYMGIYGSKETHILAYFTQWLYYTSRKNHQNDLLQICSKEYFLSFCNTRSSKSLCICCNKLIICPFFVFIAAMVCLNQFCMIWSQTVFPNRSFWWQLKRTVK